MKLSKQEIEDLIDRLKNGEVLPDDYKYKLFPIKQKEYELVYGGKMRREDILANEDGVFPVPLQIEKIFNGKREQWKDGWKNIIAFGDNLQFLFQPGNVRLGILTDARQHQQIRQVDGDGVFLVFMNDLFQRLEISLDGAGIDFKRGGFGIIAKPETENDRSANEIFS